MSSLSCVVKTVTNLYSVICQNYHGLQVWREFIYLFICTLICDNSCFTHIHTKVRKKYSHTYYPAFAETFSLTSNKTYANGYGLLVRIYSTSQIQYGTGTAVVSITATENVFSDSNLQIRHFVVLSEVILIFRLQKTACYFVLVSREVLNDEIKFVLKSLNIPALPRKFWLGDVLDNQLLWRHVYSTLLARHLGNQTDILGTFHTAD